MQKSLVGQLSFVSLNTDAASGYNSVNGVDSFTGDKTVCSGSSKRVVDTGTHLVYGEWYVERPRPTFGTDRVQQAQPFGLLVLPRLVSIRSIPGNARAKSLHFPQTLPRPDAPIKGVLIALIERQRRLEGRTQNLPSRLLFRVGVAVGREQAIHELE